MFVEKYNSIWDMYKKRGLSRRTFIKTCTAMATILGLAPTMLPEVVKAAEKRLPVVIWLHGQECTGCTESFARSGAPFTSDVVLNMIALEYDDTLAAASGAPFEHHLEEVMKAYKGQYIVCIEGAVPIVPDSGFCMVGGKSFYHQVKEVCENAAAVINVGSCACWGGIQAATPNPSQSKPITEIVSGKPIVQVPGCPPIPEVITGVVAYYAMYGRLPALDDEGKPKQFFGNRVHDTCYRRPFFDAGLYAESFNDKGAKAGWCLYKVGCRGPETYSSCGNLRWYNGLSYPIQSGAPCIGCTNKDFWDQGPFYERMPQIPGASALGFGNVDKAGAIVAAGAVVGVIGHVAASVYQKKRKEFKKAKRYAGTGKRKD